MITTHPKQTTILKISTRRIGSLTKKKAIIEIRKGEVVSTIVVKVSGA